MGVAELVDQHFTPHGNWQGLSMGWMGMTWLGHILSVGDHRLNHVQPWVERNLKTVQNSLQQEVSGLDFTDDRLGIFLDALGDDAGWAEFETALNQRSVRVYDLKLECVRIDSTTASGYCGVSEDGLFQFGHSKDHRPDLPQVKVMQSTLDPFGMPVATQIVSGEQADDRLYIPAIQQVRCGLKKQGLLYVGDCKLMALANRAYLAAGQDFYLAPFSKVQIPEERLIGRLQPVWQGEQALTPVYRTNAQGETEKIAEGFECQEVLTEVIDGQTVTWTERQLLVRSLAQAKAGETALQSRLAKAQAALDELNQHKQGKKRFTEVEALRLAAEKIIDQQEVAGLLSLDYQEQVQERTVRAYGERPEEVRSQRTVSVHYERNEAAVQQRIAPFGWRVYGTNHSKDQLPLDKAVLAYRQEYLVERGFARMKGKSLSLTPLYLQQDRRITGLIRWLSVGLRILTLVEFVVRSRLADNQEKLRGLYAGNPTRSTATPRAETLLEAFKSIHLTSVVIGPQTHLHVTPLSDLQQKILSLLGLSPDIYTRLAHSLNPP